MSSAAEMLNREFLSVRCRLLDVAASLDRIGRRDGGSAAEQDRRYAQIASAIRILNEGGASRAERVQMVFSNPYDGD